MAKRRNKSVELLDNKYLNTRLEEWLSFVNLKVNLLCRKYTQQKPKKYPMAADIIKETSKSSTSKKKTIKSIKKPKTMTIEYFPKIASWNILAKVFITSLLKNVSGICKMPFRFFCIHQSEKIVNIIKLATHNCNYPRLLRISMI